MTLFYYCHDIITTFMTFKWTSNSEEFHFNTVTVPALTGGALL